MGECASEQLLNLLQACFLVKHHTHVAARDEMYS